MRISQPVPVLLAVAAFAASVARAEDPAPTPAGKVGGYVESYGSWNANAPSNHITNARGFDSRSGSFTLSNVVLDGQWDSDRLVGRATLQAGATPSSYTLAEPFHAGTATVAVSDAQLWRYVQQAWAGYRFGEHRQLNISAGLFLSPIGPETIPVKDNWNWSRSNLFFNLPFYHSGVRAALATTTEWTLTAMVCNGWNAVVDANDSLSMSLEALRTTTTGRYQLLYFGGVERPTGAPEGQPWRHLVDAFGQWSASSTFDLLVHADIGSESNRFGRTSWLSGAAAARALLMPKWWMTLRADALRETVASGPAGRAAPLFVPVPWVASATATLDFRPEERASFRLEWRHDRAGGDLYFGGRVQGDGVSAPFVPNRRAQSTVTLGATTWF
jgi:hypothetical protein